MTKLTKVTVMVDLTIRQNKDDEPSLVDILDECYYEFKASQEHEELGITIEHMDMWDYTNVRIKTVED